MTKRVSTKKEEQLLPGLESSQFITGIRAFIDGSEKVGKHPLFVLGSGVSQGVVPMTWEIAQWLLSELKRDLGESALNGDLEWIEKYGNEISNVNGSPTRRQVAEFFSQMQVREDPFEKVWSNFETSFLFSGLGEHGISSKYFGVASTDLIATSSHLILADLLKNNKAFVLSLNFDGLTRRAVTQKKFQSVGLHDSSEIYHYFTSLDSDQLPAVFNVRGDVFFAKCSRAACPVSRQPYPLERVLSNIERSTEKKEISALICPTCNKESLKLEFSFPGYREKEEQAEPVLWTLRRFIGSRISAIIILGLSGRWDRHLLRFLFDLASERRILIVDVKPQSPNENLLEGFRRRFYPAISLLTRELQEGNGHGLVLMTEKANAFMSSLYPEFQSKKESGEN